MSKRTDEDIVLKDRVIQRLIALRQSTGLTQSAFAREHDLDRQQVNNWESFSNKRGLSIYTINKFCQMVGISLSEFFDDDLFKAQ